jgi:hypothetical protein
VIAILISVALAAFISIAWANAISRENRRREPVVYVWPRAKVIGVPTVTRRKHPAIWPNN